MSCINLDIRVINEPLVLSMERIGGMSVGVSMASEQMSIRVIDTVTHPKMRVSIVCSIKELRGYLNVSPEDIQWITPDYGIIYKVESDTDWIIVTS